MNIIWGYKADPHITAQQLRNTYIGIFGDGTNILDVGSALAATVISATEVQIADGVMVAQGCTASIENGVSESLVIANGTQGMLRRDLIVAQYTKNSGTGVESMSLAVKTGTPAASNPATPSYTTGSIADGDTLVEFPLYQVNLDGISITSVDPLVSTVCLLDQMITTQSTLTEVQTALENTKAVVVNAPLGTLTFNSAGVAGGTVSVAQYIPNGFDMILAVQASSGYFGAYFYTCSAASATTVLVQLMRISGTQANTTPVVKLLCTKNL